MTSRTRSTHSKRTDAASRIIKASPQAIYQAFIDPAAVAAWLPPKGMTGQVHEFDPRAGGSYRMSLHYEDAEHVTRGKTSESTDVVEGKFLEVVPDTRIVQLIEFVSDDPAFSGAMTMTWSIAIVPAGSEVSILCENVPEGIRQEDHEAGLSSTLENLAAYIE